MRSADSPITSPVVRSAILRLRAAGSRTAASAARARPACRPAWPCRSASGASACTTFCGNLIVGVAGRVGAAGDHHVGLAALDGGGRERDRLQARGARARDGHALDRRRQAQIERDLAPDVDATAAAGSRRPTRSRRSRLRGSSSARASARRAATPSAMVSSCMNSVNALTNGVRMPPTITARRPLATFVRPMLLAIVARALKLRCSAPPHTRSTCPVTPAAPGVARNVIACATSSGRPPWPSADRRRPDLADHHRDRGGHAASR